jgi:hypothetical protein
MTDRGDRSDRLRKRFEDEPAEDDTDGDESHTDGDRTDDTTSDTGSVKDRPSVLMYLPEETRRELDVRFDELNARYKREYGESLEKNRDYYPAVVRAGLEGESVDEILGLS